VKAALLGTTAATSIEIWFQDEARVGQKGTHGYIWAPVGSRPLMVRDNRHDSAYIFGAICPTILGNFSPPLTLIDDPDRIRSLGTRDWACVNV
jgi:hypothetical protein